MKFTVNRQQLKTTLSLLHGVIEKKVLIPILANFRLDCAGSLLKITATDTDMEISETIEAQAAEDGSVTIPGHTLYSLIDKVDDDLVTFTAKEYSVEIRAGNARFSLGSLPAEDFPVFKSDSTECEIIIDSVHFHRQLKFVRGAMSNDETRHYLNGVHFHKMEGSDVLRAVATDGHRLYLADEPAAFSGVALNPFILPRKAVPILEKFLDSFLGDVTVCAGGNIITVSAGNVTISSRLIDGTFPDYNRVIPSTWENEITVASELLKKSADIVAVVCEEKSRAVRIDFDGASATLSAQGDTSGSSAKDEISVMGGKKGSHIGFNSTYLLNGLDRFTGSLVIKISDESSPTIFSQPEDPSRLMVLMPMRV
jgi:DNA polymerase-3 subunit beta